MKRVPTMCRWLFTVAVFLTAGSVAYGGIVTSPLPDASDWADSRSTDDGVIGTHQWGTGGWGFRIEWSVTLSGDVDFPFLYEYWLTSNELMDAGLDPDTWESYFLLGDGNNDVTRALSHWTLSVSPNAEEEDFDLDFSVGSGYVWGDHSEPPGEGTFEIFGIKFDFENHYYAFTSTKSPVWGDFFAIDGNVPGGDPVMAYNYGLEFPLSEEVSFDKVNYILVPDTFTVPGDPGQHVIPEPASVLVWSLLAAGGAALAWRRRRSAAVVERRGRWSPEARAAIMEVVGGDHRHLNA